MSLVDELVVLLLKLLGKEALHQKIDEQDEIRAARAAADAEAKARFNDPSL